MSETSHKSHPTRNIRKTFLPNGLMVLTESIPHVRSVSMGAWINSGSRDETPVENGIAHFVEHMVFKGTTTRSAKDIAREVDTIGGNLDAFTGKETVCFNIKVLDENLPPALDVLSDLVLHPRFTAEDLEKEQGVILEEIKMDEDNPDYLVHETFTQNFWKNHALGRPILGTAETVSSFTQQTVFDHHNRRFTPRHMVFSAAGNLDHDAFLARVETKFGSLSATTAPLEAVETAPLATPHITLKRKKSLEQVQMCLGVVAPPVNHADRYGLYLLNSMLGGGMSSRLFQSVREDSGLAYSIYSEMNPFRDTGSLSVYAGMSLENTERVLQLTLAELRRLKEEPVHDGELDRAKNQLKSNIVLGLESSSSRMSNLARQQMYFGRFFTVDDITAAIDAVRIEDVQRLANELLRPECLALTLLGNLGAMKIGRADLAC
ncbi:Predicted Zn-dependent peptidase [Granulicella rosea]|uniref:Predicted Zn-dependent peptidase n=1 Tax=Granulicella rosea TaxID=474952 RepID=A0A239EVG7_9BACT|nr:pitrilysin family protein [Granulicella rosea]SNS48760.1 Predicted Zn-dependent peptidase [Granulicella rosea]